MYETTYHRATSVADAAAKIAACEDGKILSGGMTLLPTMKQRLARVRPCRRDPCRRSEGDH